MRRVLFISRNLQQQVDKLSGSIGSASDTQAGGMGSWVRDPVAESNEGEGGGGVGYDRSGLNIDRL